MTKNVIYENNRIVFICCVTSQNSLYSWICVFHVWKKVAEKNLRIIFWKCDIISKYRTYQQSHKIHRNNMFEICFFLFNWGEHARYYIRCILLFSNNFNTSLAAFIIHYMKEIDNDNSLSYGKSWQVLTKNIIYGNNRIFFICLVTSQNSLYLWVCIFHGNTVEEMSLRSISLKNDMVSKCRIHQQWHAINHFPNFLEIIMKDF